MHERRQLADLRRHPRQVVVVQVERRQELQAPQLGAEVAYRPYDLQLLPVGLLARDDVIGGHDAVLPPMVVVILCVIAVLGHPGGFFLQGGSGQCV